MQSSITKLFPPGGESVEHQGLYLRQDLRSIVKPGGSPFVYANFIVSLDGRIAVPDPDSKGVALATQITNKRDWRLFQELAVQADVLITSGRYLREYEEGPKQELLQVYDDPAFRDLGEWRRSRGLSDYPAVAVLSRSLDFNVPQPLRDPQRELFVFTTEQSDTGRKTELASQGAQVITAGENGISGKTLVDELQTAGYRFIYSTAGPRILHLLLTGKVLDRLYLTFASRILGGDPFSSIVEGPLLGSPADFKIHSLYFDPQEPDNLGQFYATFDRQEHTPE
ncbi:MAG: dihydrofolate reductase family protein [Anaerolineales bacterium]|nr:dihydrofolate reductase family protein [Anaerolineales bacterium]